MCYPRGEFRIGDADVELGRPCGDAVLIAGPQFAYWSHTHLTVDVVPGAGRFSLEAPRACAS